jgi:hypothetical protein
VVRRRFDVRRLSAVANLAGYRPVAGLIVHLGNIWMARRADFVSRIDERLGGIGINCSGAVMAQGAESLGDEKVAGANQSAD